MPLLTSVHGRRLGLDSEDNLFAGGKLLSFLGINATQVAAKANRGEGTESNPYTGWDSRILWTPGTSYLFDGGWYECESSPDGWSQTDLTIIGQGPHTVLRFTDSGFVMDGGAVDGPTTIRSCLIGNFIIDGAGVCDTGLFLRGVSRSTFFNIRVRNVTDVGIDQRFGVLNSFYNPRVAEVANLDDYVMPDVHFQMRARNDTTTTDYSSGNTILNPIMEGNINGTGIKLVQHTLHTQFYGGTCEGLSVGIEVGTDNTDCNKNAFHGVDLEVNSVDIDVYRGFSNQFLHAGIFSTPVEVNVNTPTGTFLFGETVTWSTGGGTAQVKRYTAGVLEVTAISGTWTDGATTGSITGSTSGAVATLTSPGIDFQVGAFIRSAATGTQFLGGNLSFLTQERGTATQFLGMAMRDSYLDSFFIDAVQLACRDFTQNITVNRLHRVDRYTPVSGDTITVAKGTKLAEIVTAGTLSALTITFPPTPYNQQEFTFLTKSAITTLTCNPTSGSIGTAPTSAAAGTGFSFIWSTTDTTWLRKY
jgi:hypothetical protein